MDWRHLIDMAKLLAGQTGPPAPGRPRQAMLKRAVSTAYYALFHALCYSNANVLTGRAAGRPPYPLAWTRTYRAMDHGPASDAMRRQAGNMPMEILDFTITFRFLQEQRHKADYDPEARFRRSEVISLINRTETAIQTFFSANAAERRTLAAVVLMRAR